MLSKSHFPVWFHSLVLNLISIFLTGTSSWRTGISCSSEVYVFRSPLRCQALLSAQLIFLPNLLGKGQTRASPSAHQCKSLWISQMHSGRFHPILTVAECFPQITDHRRHSYFVLVPLMLFLQKRKITNYRLASFPSGYIVIVKRLDLFHQIGCISFSSISPRLLDPASQKAHLVSSSFVT